MDKKEFWDALADNHKDNNEKFNLPTALNLANVMQMDQAQSIVEVGCGSGAFTVYCLCNFGKTRSYTSIDVSKRMIDLAEERKSCEKGVNTKIDHKFVVGSACELSSIDDGSQDVYVSLLCLHLVSDRKRFLEEANRVLKKGGKIGLIVPCKEGTIMELLERNLVKVGSGPFFPASVWELGYKGVLKRLLEESGFRVQYCWRDNFKLPYYSDEDIDEQLSRGITKAAFESLTVEQKKLYRKGVVKDFSKMRDAHEPPQIQVMSIVAVKDV